METRELQRVSREIQKLTQTNVECLVSAADVHAARARARALSTPRNNADASVNKGPEIVKDQHGRRSPPSAIQVKGHHRALITPRPAYRRSLHAANVELMSFREKFNQWKMTYDREIGKTKASLASMTPTLQGLGLAARMHKIAGKAAESLNGSTASSSESLNPTPSKEESQTPICSTVETTPRTELSEAMMEASLLPLQLDIDFLSTTDEYPDFFDDDLPLSERAGKLAAVNEDIDVLTTIIEKKIYATHISTPVPDEVDIMEEDAAALDLCAWSEGELTARSVKMLEDIALSEPDSGAEMVEESTEVDMPQMPIPTEDIPQTVTTDVPREAFPGTKTNKSNNVGVDPPPKPVNLRDNLIILAKQKGFTHVGTPINEVLPNTPSEREIAMALLRKMYAPSPSPTTTQTLVVCEQSMAAQSLVTTPSIQTPAPSISESPNLDATSARPTPTEVTVCGETLASQILPEAGDMLVTSKPADMPGTPDVGEFDKRNSSTASAAINKLKVDGEATFDVPPVVSRESLLKDASEVHREIVICNSYRIDQMPVNLYEGLDCGITIN